MSQHPSIPADSDRVTGDGETIEADTCILASGGQRIPAHASVLALASPVFASIFERPKKHQSAKKTIPMLGVPSDAVAAFVRFLYSNECNEEQMKTYGIHLLALSHVYLVPQLKHRCARALVDSLTFENVVDVLQLARLCDAPDLYLKCIKLVSENFKTVESTEGWKFLQNYDPYLELEILEFIDEADTRRKRTKRRREEQYLYLQLSEAMECLEHICSEGCVSVGPYDKEPSKNNEPCSNFSTCRGLQLLIKHFASCNRRVNGGCTRCKRMWQLFRLHSSICDQPEACRVPLCWQFRLSAQQKGKKEEETRWKMLVKRVASAKAISSLSNPKRKREEELKRTADPSAS